MLLWTTKQQATATPLWFVVEATGVYYEALAYFLSDNEQALSVLLPNKVKHFAQSIEQKSKTDQLDARLLCRLGLERALPAWQPPTPALRQVRALARERQNLKRQGTRLKTQRHAYDHSYQPDARTLERLVVRQQLFTAVPRSVYRLFGAGGRRKSRPPACCSTGNRADGEKAARPARTPFWEPL